MGVQNQGGGFGDLVRGQLFLGKRKWSLYYNFQRRGIGECYLGRYFFNFCFLGVIFQKCQYFWITGINNQNCIGIKVFNIWGVLGVERVVLGNQMVLVRIRRVGENCLRGFEWWGFRRQGCIRFFGRFIVQKLWVYWFGNDRDLGLYFEALVISCVYMGLLFQLQFFLFLFIKWG